MSRISPTLPFGRRFIAGFGLIAATMPLVTGTACPPGISGREDGVLVTCLCEPPPADVSIGAVAADEPPLGAIEVADAAFIDVVFVLDTTGSMSGLIEGAKQKIWAIAGALATAEPRPRVRIGLVGYRDRGDDYVTVRTELTEDLDAVYADLMNYQAAGGGDTPESVNAALHEAVSTFEWSPEDEAMKFVFLVGDAPPKVYEQEPQHLEICLNAASHRIIINTLQCGAMASTTPIWKAIAQAAEGEYFKVPQSGGAVVIATPFDPTLVELNGQVQATMIDYGSGQAWASQVAKRQAGAAIEEAADEAVLASRALYANTASGMVTLCGPNELVFAYSNGTIKIADVPVEDLPEHMKEMTVAEREAHVQAVAAERAKLQARVAEVAVEREAWLQNWRAEQGLNGLDAFDQLMVQAMARQCGVNGIHIPVPEPAPASATPAGGAADPGAAPAPAPAPEPVAPPVIERSMSGPPTEAAIERMKSVLEDDDC